MRRGSRPGEQGTAGASWVEASAGQRTQELHGVHSRSAGRALFLAAVRGGQGPSDGRFSKT